MMEPTLCERCGGEGVILQEDVEEKEEAQLCPECLGVGLKKHLTFTDLKEKGD